MIYKFETALSADHLSVLEAQKVNKNCFIQLENIDLSKNESKQTYIYIDPSQLYKLIGALHEIQKDIRKEGSNG